MYLSASWRFPEPDRVAERIFEGKPSADELEKMRFEAQSLQDGWQPREDAWDELIELQKFVGQRIHIQFDDPLIELCGVEEGPNPLRADCTGIITAKDNDFLQAFLVLTNVELLWKTADGSLQKKPITYSTDVAVIGASGRHYGVQSIDHCRRMPGLRKILAPVRSIYSVVEVGLGKI